MIKYIKRIIIFLIVFIVVILCSSIGYRIYFRSIFTSDNTDTGKIYKRYLNGQKIFEGRFVGDKSVGIHRWWYKNGQIKCEMREKGLCKFWDKDGNLLDVTESVNGRSIYIDFYPNGVRKRLITYNKDGRAEGLSVDYDKRGRVKRVLIYCNGKIIKEMFPEDIIKEAKEEK